MPPGELLDPVAEQPVCRIQHVHGTGFQLVRGVSGRGGVLEFRQAVFTGQEREGIPHPAGRIHERPLPHFFRLRLLKDRPAFLANRQHLIRDFPEHRFGLLQIVREGFLGIIGIERIVLLPAGKRPEEIDVTERMHPSPINL